MKEIEQGDEHLLESFRYWLIENFPRLEFQIKMPLKKLFPKPAKEYLRPFWGNKNAHADVAVFRHHKLVCVVEPGGGQHLTDDKQKWRDEKKAQLCRSNGVNFLPLINSCLNYKETPNFKRLLKCYFYRQ